MYKSGYIVFTVSVLGTFKVITIFIRDCLSIFHIFILLFLISSLQMIVVNSVNPISFTVTENCAVGNIVGDMSVYKVFNNTTLSSKIYSMESIENDQFRELFLINTITGVIRVNRAIDRETICPQLSGTSGTCTVTLLVTILNEILNIIVIIVDENDNAPSFEAASLPISIKESSPVGTIIFVTHAKDLDGLYNGVGEYSLTTDKAPNVFNLRYNSTVIYLESTQTLDYESCAQYRLILSVCDIGTPKLCSSQSLKVSVIDVNDNFPKFSNINYLAIINEDHSTGKEVLQIFAEDRDSPLYNVVRYRISSINNDATIWFRLDPTSGRIFLTKPMVTKIRNFKFVVEAYDNGPIPNVNRTLVTIHVKDVNNHFPEIKVRKSTFSTTIIKKDQHNTKVSFYENNPVNTDVVFVVVTDKDSDENGMVHCSMDQGGHTIFDLKKFNWNRNKVIYRLVVLDSTDCEVQRRYNIVINCSDSGDRPKMTTETIEINVLDVNEFSARFNQSLYVAKIREDAPTFRIAMPIIEDDCTVDFTIEIVEKYAREHFKYVISTQQLELFAQLNFEEIPSVKFAVRIIDKGDSNTVLSSTSSVDVTVIDVNDNTPVLVKPTTFYIEENARIGTTIGQLRANDSDQYQNAKIQFQKIKVITKDHSSAEYNSFLITSDGAIKLAKELDRERQDLYLLTVEVSDMGTAPLSSTGTVTLLVLDINDNSPQWIFPNNNDNKVNESIYTQEGVAITRVHAVDIDGPGNNNITYTLLSQHSKDFFLHPTKGELSFITPPRIGVFILELIVSDNGKPQRTNSTRLFVYVSDAELRSTGADTFPSRSYFTIVAVVPVLILICLLVLILCLLLMVRRRNARTKNRRNQLKTKHPENLTRKPSNISNTKEKLLNSNIIEMDSVSKTHRLETLDLTQNKSLPKLSYQCLISNDLDVCSADSGQGASEEDFSNYFMLKSGDNYRVTPCNQHCCSPLPENSIAHFICSTINHPILYNQPILTYGDNSNQFPCRSPASSPSSSKLHLNPIAYNETCVNSSYVRH